MQTDKYNITFDDINDEEDIGDFPIQCCNAFSSQKEFQERVKHIQNESVLSMLRRTSTGRFILKEYEIRGQLSDKSSKDLSNLIDNVVCDSTT